MNTYKEVGALIEAEKLLLGESFSANLTQMQSLFQYEGLPKLKPSIQNNGQPEPIYEDFKGMSKAYEEFLAVIENNLSFFEELKDILNNIKFQEIFKDNPQLLQLIQDYCTTIETIIVEQNRILVALKNSHNNSNEIINNIKEAYASDFNNALYIQTSIFVNFLDKTIQQTSSYKEGSKQFFLAEKKEKKPSETSLIMHMFRSKQSGFSNILMQRSTRTPLMLSALVLSFREGHPRIHELEPVCLKASKMVKDMNRAQEGYAVDYEKNSSTFIAISDIQQKVGANTTIKQFSFQLLKCIWLYLYSSTAPSEITMEALLKKSSDDTTQDNFVILKKTILTLLENLKNSLAASSVQKAVSEAISKIQAIEKSAELPMMIAIVTTMVTALAQPKPANATLAAISKQDIEALMEAEKALLGKSFSESVDALFENMLYAGLPPLTAKKFYSYMFKVVSSIDDIPKQKEPDVAYLYVQNGELYYLFFDGQLERSGTLTVEKDKKILLNSLSESTLTQIKDSLHEQLIEKENISLSDINNPAGQKAYGELLDVENNLLKNIAGFISIIKDEHFIRIFEKDTQSTSFIKELLAELEALYALQDALCDNLQLGKTKHAKELIYIIEQTYAYHFSPESNARLSRKFAELDVLIKKPDYAEKVNAFARNRLDEKNKEMKIYSVTVVTKLPAAADLIQQKRASGKGTVYFRKNKGKIDYILIDPKGITVTGDIAGDLDIKNVAIQEYLLKEVLKNNRSIAQETQFDQNANIAEAFLLTKKASAGFSSQSTLRRCSVLETLSKCYNSAAKGVGDKGVEISVNALENTFLMANRTAKCAQRAQEPDDDTNIKVHESLQNKIHDNMDDVRLIGFELLSAVWSMVNSNTLPFYDGTQSNNEQAILETFKEKLIKNLQALKFYCAEEPELADKIELTIDRIKSTEIVTLPVTLTAIVTLVDELTKVADRIVRNSSSKKEAAERAALEESVEKDKIMGLYAYKEIGTLLEATKPLFLGKSFSEDLKTMQSLFALDEPQLKREFSAENDPNYIIFVNKAYQEIIALEDDFFLFYTGLIMMLKDEDFLKIFNTEERELIKQFAQTIRLLIEQQVDIINALAKEPRNQPLDPKIILDNIKTAYEQNLNKRLYQNTAAVLAFLDKKLQEPLSAKAYKEFCDSEKNKFNPLIQQLKKGAYGPTITPFCSRFSTQLVTRRKMAIQDQLISNLIPDQTGIESLKIILPVFSQIATEVNRAQGGYKIDRNSASKQFKASSNIQRKIGDDTGLKHYSFKLLELIWTHLYEVTAPPELNVANLMERLAATHSDKSIGDLKEKLLSVLSAIKEKLYDTASTQTVEAAMITIRENRPMAEIIMAIEVLMKALKIAQEKEFAPQSNNDYDVKEAAKEIGLLVSAQKEVLGKSVTSELDQLFSGLLPKELPELDNGATNSLSYLLCSSPEEIPENKVPYCAYLYVKDNAVHYQLLNPHDKAVSYRGIFDTVPIHASLLRDCEFIPSPPQPGDRRKAHYIRTRDNLKCIYIITNDAGEIQQGTLNIDIQATDENIKAKLSAEVINKHCGPKEPILHALEDRLKSQLIEKGHFAYSYEKSFSTIAKRYTELFKQEETMLRFFEDFEAILADPDFIAIFKDNAEALLLFKKIQKELKALIPAQYRILKVLSEGEHTSTAKERSERVQKLLAEQKSSVLISRIAQTEALFSPEHYAKLMRITSAFDGLKDQTKYKEFIQLFASENARYKLQLGEYVTRAGDYPTLLESIQNYNDMVEYYLNASELGLRTRMMQLMTRKILMLREFRGDFRAEHPTIHAVDVLYQAIDAAISSENRAAAGNTSKNHAAIANIQDKIKSDETKTIVFGLLKSIWEIVYSETFLHADTETKQKEFEACKLKLLKNFESLKTKFTQTEIVTDRFPANAYAFESAYFETGKVYLKWHNATLKYALKLPNGAIIMKTIIEKASDKDIDVADILQAIIDQNEDIRTGIVIVNPSLTLALETAMETVQNTSKVSGLPEAILSVTAVTQAIASTKREAQKKEIMKELMEQPNKVALIDATLAPHLRLSAPTLKTKIETENKRHSTPSPSPMKIERKEFFSDLPAVNNNANASARRPFLGKSSINIELTLAYCAAGDADAFYVLAQAAVRGDGVPKDPVAAYYLALLALERGKKGDRIIKFIKDLDIPSAEKKCRGGFPRITLNGIIYDPKTFYQDYLEKGKEHERVLSSRLFQSIDNEQLKQKVTLLTALPRRKETTNLDIKVMQELSIAGNAMGLFFLATATYHGDKIEKDPVAAYYLALLAFEKAEIPSERISAGKVCENKAKLIKFLQKLPIPAENAKCETKLVINGKETDPKTLYQEYMRTKPKSASAAAPALAVNAEK